MKTTVEIAGTEIDVDYDFKITTRGHGGTAPSLNYPGDPPEAAEFEIEVIGLRFPKQAADVADPEMPEWLKDVITTHLYERDDVNNAIQRADQEQDYYED